MMRCTWERGEPRRPFQFSSGEIPREYRWSEDGSRLWCCSRAGGDWSQWDPLTGLRLRRALVPDDVASPVLSAADELKLVGRQPSGRPFRRILACSRDLRTAITVQSPSSLFTELRRVADDGFVVPIANARAPYAFSADGRRIVGMASGARALVFLDADDASVLEQVPFLETVTDLTDFFWTGGGELLINIGVPGHRADRLICYSVDAQRTLWQHSGYFRRIHVDRDERSAAALADDGSVVVWNIANGDVMAKEPNAPAQLLWGEPDVLATLSLLRANPIELALARPVTSLDAVTGETKPSMSEDERAAAKRALRVSADGLTAGPLASDGTFAVFLVERNVREVSDPDAGRVVHLDASVALWDRRKQEWRWETPDSPPGLVLSWLFEQGTFELSWDESGIFARTPAHGTSATLYDIGTGSLRLPRAGDYPPTPPRLSAETTTRLLATDRNGRWALGARETTIELWSVGSNEKLGERDLEEAPTVAAFLDGETAFVVGTEHGRTLRFEFDG